MRLRKLQPSPRHRRDPKRDAADRTNATAPVPAGEAPTAREPDDEHARTETADTGFRASSYDLRQGLDVVELATSLPADVLDRLFKSPQR